MNLACLELTNDNRQPNIQFTVSGIVWLIVIVCHYIAKFLNLDVISGDLASFVFLKRHGNHQAKTRFVWQNKGTLQQDF